MKHLPALKNLPSPFRSLLHPWVAVSLALHGLLLFLPIPQAPEPPELVSLTELPSPVAIPPAPTPSPTLPAPIAKPSPPPTPRPAAIPPARPAPASIAPPPSTPIATPAAAPISPPAPSPPTPIATPIASPSPSPIPTPTPSPSPSLSPSPSPGPEVPLVEGAIAGCLGSDQCWETTDTQWRSIARNLQQTLRDRGYELTEIPLSDDAGRRIYRLAKPEEPPQYLHLISTLQGTRYVFRDEPMSPEEMNQAAGF